MTANKLYANSKKNMTSKPIHQLDHYFYQVANQQKIQFSRNEIFAEICSLHRPS